MAEPIDIRPDPQPGEVEFAALWQAAWGSAWRGDRLKLWAHSLAHFGTYAGARLVGYVNLAWDGGIHGFILDPTVHPDYRHRGIGRRLVQAAADLARNRGLDWLHVDYEPELEPFYRACGFRPSLAGVMRLRD